MAKCRRMNQTEKKGVRKVWSLSSDRCIGSAVMLLSDGSRYVLKSGVAAAMQ
jgi:hypothetical protein